MIRLVVSLVPNRGYGHPAGIREAPELTMDGSRAAVDKANDLAALEAPVRLTKQEG